MKAEINAVNAQIYRRSADSQRRIDVIANILRDMLNADDTGEVELAFTLVLAELANRE